MKVLTYRNENVFLDIRFENTNASGAIKIDVIYTQEHPYKATLLSDSLAENLLPVVQSYYYDTNIVIDVREPYVI